MDLEIFGTRKGFLALLATVRFLFGVRSNVNEHFVASVETALGTRTIVPLAVVESGGTADRVRMGDMRGELFERLKGPVFCRWMDGIIGINMKADLTININL